MGLKSGSFGLRSSVRPAESSSVTQRFLQSLLPGPARMAAQGIQGQIWHRAEALPVVTTLITFVTSDSLKGDFPKFNTADCQALPELHILHFLCP